MARRVVIQCEKHPDREGEEVCISAEGDTSCVDLCEECRQPLLELMKLGRPAEGKGTTAHAANRALASRIRGVPPLQNR